MDFKSSLSASLARLIAESAAAFKLILSEADSKTAPWIDPYAAGYNRGYAEDILHNTINPLDSKAHYTKEWRSKNFTPPPDFAPGGPAPQFTPEQFIIAVAGDPTVAITGQTRSDTEKGRSPRNPGSYGSAPVYRIAKKLAGKGSRSGSWEDYYSLGLTALSQMIRPGVDRGEPPFIKRLMVDVKHAMLNGLGGTAETMAASGKSSQLHKNHPLYGIKGLQSIIDNPTAEQALKVAAQVKPPFDVESRSDKNIDNPFGWYSTDIVKACKEFAAIASSGDEEATKKALQGIIALQERIDFFNQASSKGASTGMLSTIDTPDRVTQIKTTSLDKPKEGPEGGVTSAAGSVPDRMTQEADRLDPGMISDMIELMLYGYADMIKDTPYLAKLTELGLPTGGQSTYDTTKVKETEYRMLLRILGEAAASYPGKGTERSNIQIQRGNPGWYVAGTEDPELEPSKEGPPYKSPWLRSGMPVLSLDGIRRSFETEEEELTELAKEGKVAPPGKLTYSNKLSRDRYNEVLGKLKAVALILRNEASEGGTKRKAKTEQEKALQQQQSAYNFFNEWDAIDRVIIVESLDKLLRSIDTRITMSVLAESKLLRNFIRG